MEKTGFAYFVEGPRIIEDLKGPYPIEQEMQYEIVKTVKLAKIDYENFIADMIADRKFIEDNAVLCSQGEVWRCILVQQRGRTDGVLVVPVDGCYVGWAAYYSGFWTSEPFSAVAMVVSVLERTSLIHLILMNRFQIGNGCSLEIAAQCLYYTACHIIERKTNEIIRKVRIISFVL